MRLTTEQLTSIRNYFTDQPVLKAFVFGSYVRDEATADSDVDILVELDYDQIFGLEFVQMQLELQEILSKNVDLVSARGISKYIKPIVDREKQLIYAR